MCIRDRLGVFGDVCLDLPKKTFMKRVVTLTPDQLKVYKEMSRLAVASFNGKLMTTATVLTQLMRLQQITCGNFTSDDGVMTEIPTNRLPELMDLLGEIEGKVVIWAHFQRDVHRIIELISKEYGQDSFVYCLVYFLVVSNHNNLQNCLAHTLYL